MRLPQVSGTKLVKNLSDVFLQHHTHKQAIVCIYTLCTIPGSMRKSKTRSLPIVNFSYASMHDVAARSSSSAALFHHFNDDEAAT